MNRFVLKDRQYDAAIQDQEHNLNFAFVAGSGHGIPSTHLALAQKVVDFLNSLPPEETLLYPHNRK